MAQIDKIIYIPLVFWFIMLLILVYFIIFSFFISTFLSISKIRVFFFFELTNIVKIHLNNIKGLYAYPVVDFLLKLANSCKVIN